MTAPRAETDLLAKRLIVATAAGCVAALYSLSSAQHRHQPSDFAQLWHAAAAWEAGANPYEAIGPGRAFPWHFPLLYPFTAVLVAVPFSRLPEETASALFIALGTAMMVWTLTRGGVSTPHLAGC